MYRVRQPSLVFACYCCWFWVWLADDSDPFNFCEALQEQLEPFMVWSLGLRSLRPVNFSSTSTYTSATSRLTKVCKVCFFKLNILVVSHVHGFNQESQLVSPYYR